MSAQPNNPIDWLICAAIGMSGGLIQNIVNPTQRGFAGFVSAAAVGTFCGFVGGSVAYEFEMSSAMQWVASAMAGVFGFSVLQGVFSMLNERKRRREQGGRNIYVSGGQNVIGDNDINGGVNQQGDERNDLNQGNPDE